MENTENGGERSAQAPFILLVEDDVAIAETIIYALQREHFTVRHCLLASEALAQWRSALPDVTVLDVGLPDSNGFDLCKQLRRISARPILFLSAHNAEIDRVLGFELGADDYLCKPFSPRELALRVKALLKRSQHAGTVVQARAPEPKRAEAGKKFALVHDEMRACIFWGPQRLSLTRSEYCLLAKLLTQPERVFSREQLLQALGPLSEDSADRAIDTLIKQLRAKLRSQCVHDSDKTGNDNVQESAVEDCIVTHRGLGYSVRLTS